MVALHSSSDGCGGQAECGGDPADDGARFDGFGVLVASVDDGDADACADGDGERDTADQLPRRLLDELGSKWAVWVDRSGEENGEGAEAGEV